MAGSKLVRSNAPASRDGDRLPRPVVERALEGVQELMVILTPVMIDAFDDDSVGTTEIDVHVRVDRACAQMDVEIGTRAIAEAVPLSLRVAPLSQAERRVLPYLATNLAVPEIAQQLHLSRHTVKSHSIRIYRKLGVTCRNDAVEAARRLGLLARYAVLPTPT